MSFNFMPSFSEFSSGLVAEFNGCGVFLIHPSIMGYWSELKTWLLKDPAKIIRYVVLFVCCIIVIVQLCECFSKLDHPPISTHSYFNVNETIEMPAVTICREPPYKEQELSNVSGNYCPHPRYNSCWMSFPYDEVDLTEFFMNSTYAKEETFHPTQHGLNGLLSNIEITSSIHFYMGRCHTIRPLVRLNRTNKFSGYSMMLLHHMTKEEVARIPEDENRPGWHIFIHDTRENFTEVHMKASGRVEYIFAEVEESIEIKLQSQHFSNVETKYKSCSREEGYSDLKCGEICIWQQLASQTNCSGPWMEDVNVKHCSSYKSMMKLIGDYYTISQGDGDTKCDCIQPCETRIFSTYIQNRKEYRQPEPTTQVWIYYTTKLISMIEERPSYDTTQFIADVGGSLGFLLGLSVLGLIGILEHITLLLCGGVMRKMQHKHEKKLKAAKESDNNSENSDVTLDIAIVSKDKF